MNIDHSLGKILIKRKDKLNALPGLFIVKRGSGVKGELCNGLAESTTGKGLMIYEATCKVNLCEV